MPRAAGALAATVLGGLAVVVLYAVAVLGRTGRVLDESVMRDAMRAGSGLRAELLGVLDLVSVPTVAAVVAAVSAVALLRGRGDRVVSVVAVVLGSQLATQVLKAALPRPGSEANSLPSGHVTLVAALAVAVVLVLPGAMRPLAAAAGATLVAATGVATMVTGWHRPSDVAAAVAVVAATTGLVTAIRRPRGTIGPGGTRRGEGHDGRSLTPARPGPRPA